MLTDLFLKSVMILLGYFGAAPFVPIPYRVWGLFVAIAIWFALTALQSLISPWPLGVPLFLLGYVALGVFAKAIYKPDRTGSL